MTTTPTTPQPPTQPEPMSDEQADQLIEHHFGACVPTDDEYASALDFARSVADYRDDAWRSHLAARDAEVAALRKDAERYRWLRDKAPGEIAYDDRQIIMCVPFDGEQINSDAECSERTDAAIDAAIDRAGGGEGDNVAIEPRRKASARIAG